MDVFNHHSTVVFWLITSLKAYKFTVGGRHGWQHETPHIVLWAAELISFTLCPNKRLLRPKQNVNSTLLRLCMLQLKLLCQKNEVGSIETMAQGRNLSLTPSWMNWNPDLTHEFYQGGTVQRLSKHRFPRSVSLSKRCKMMVLAPDNETV